MSRVEMRGPLVGRGGVRPAGAGASSTAPVFVALGEQGPGVGAAVRVVRRQLALVAGAVTLTVAAVVAYSMWVTPVYEVTSLLGVDEKRAPVPDVYQSLSLQENAVATEIEVLRSRSLATQVVDDYALRVAVQAPRRVPRAALFASVSVAPDAPAGAYRLTRLADGRVSLDDRGQGRRVGTFPAGAPVHFPGGTLVLAAGAAREPGIDFAVVGRAAAVEQLRAQLKVDRPVRDANVVGVALRGTDPVLMKDVLNGLTARFISTRHVVQKTEARSAVEFLRRQLDTLARQLAVAEDSLRDYREREQIVHLDAEANGEVERFVTAQAERNALDAERSSLRALVAAAGEDGGARAGAGDPSRYRRLVAFPALLKNPAASELLQQLSALEDQRSALLNRRTPQDPEVRALAARIGAIDGQIHTLATTYLAGLDGQVGALDRSLAGYGASLRTIPHKEVEFARLERGTKVLGEAFQLLQTRLKEAEIAQAVEDPSVRVIDQAVLPLRPLRPNLPANVAVAIVLGLVLGLGAAFARHGVDRSVRTRADVRLATGLPVVGLIPSAEAAPRRSRRIGGRRNVPARAASAATVAGPGGAPVNGRVAEIVAGGIVADSYVRLDANVVQLAGGHSGRVLMVTSALAGDGKTTSAVNLALTLAKRGRKVLLLDADLRSSGLGAVLGDRGASGLSDWLAGRVPLDAALRRLSDGGDVSLDYLGAGTAHRDPAVLLASPRLRDGLAEMAVAYDDVIIDTPPLVVPDAVVLSRRVDGVLVVVRAGETARAALEHAVQQLRVVDAPVLGAVINDIDFRRDESYDAAFGYYGAAYGYAAAGAAELA